MTGIEVSNNIDNIIAKVKEPEKSKKFRSEKIVSRVVISKGIVVGQRAKEKVKEN